MARAVRGPVVRSRPAWQHILAWAAISLASSCAATENAEAQTAPQGRFADQSENLLVVDCLLPSQIRRLGGQPTYYSAQRAAKTSARDCEIRGGEYVAFDRANYATALRVWLPLAEGGDPAAQTYVGEIFEKGLGVPPDYAAAAAWYRRGAERGYSRAAINLGQLYEQGHGVPKDPVQALGWYRKAAGLGDLPFGLAATPAPPSQETRSPAATTKDRSSARPTDQAVGLPRPKDIAFGNYHALVIGNDEYRQLPRLKTAVNDAREIDRTLKARYGFKVTLLLDANRYQILSALNGLRERLTDKDNLFIYYAGHGELDRKNQRGNWLPIDAEPNSSANWISNIAVTDILNLMNVQQLLVVADSCYAGTLTRGSVGRLDAALSETERLKVIQLMARKRSRMVMTSGGLEPVLDSVGGSHSVFAQPFIELLQSNVGVLSGQEMFRQLQLRVAGKAQRVDAEQVPEYAPIKFAGHEAGDFFFVRVSN